MHEHEVDRRTLFRVGLGTAVAAVVGTEVTFPAAAGAAPSPQFPWIIDCDSWGARPPASPVQIGGNTTNKIILHHMAFPNVTDYSREHAMQLARDCQDLHMDANGWADTGQHFTVSRGGHVLEGRHRSLETLVTGEHQVTAAHCPGENGNAIGIENEGTYTTETPPAALVDSLVELCTAVCGQFDLNAWDIFGHWDFRLGTDCPGAAFYRLFPVIRRRVMQSMNVSPAAAPARRWPDIWRFVDSQVVQVAQYLLVNAGYSDLPIDGVFSTDMNEVVADFQTSRGISVTPDATFDTPTWEALVPTLDKGASGLPVQAVQYLLAIKGYADTIGITGAYDHSTKKAVQDMQRLHNLRPNGEIDLSTWCALVGGTVRETLTR
ncbi:peptidoglycan recognition protein family protein [Streptomyces sp. NPDC001665]